MPDIIEKHREHSEQLNITRRALYERFIDQWFEKHLSRWQGQNKLSILDDKLQFDTNSKDEWNDQRIKLLRSYAENFALNLYHANLDAISSKSPYPWVKALFDPNPYVKLVRSACPLKKIGENSYSFIHKSLLEYLVTPKMLEEIKCNTHEQIAPQLLALETSNPSSHAITFELLNQQQLSFAIIQFLADSIKENPTLQSGLWSIIAKSRLNASANVAAANAISILNRAKISFSGKDLSGIRIPGANLNGAILDNTNFENADLTNVNFIGSWLQNTHFKNAIMKGVEFGEFPSLILDDKVYCCCYSPDGKKIAVADRNNLVCRKWGTASKTKWPHRTYRKCTV